MERVRFASDPAGGDEMWVRLSGDELELLGSCLLEASELATRGEGVATTAGLDPDAVLALLRQLSDR